MKKKTLVRTLAVAICACIIAGSGTVALADSSYTVKKGDSLWKIAKAKLGDGKQYNKIYDANKDKIKNPNRIYVGQVLVIPDGKTTAESTATNKPSDDNQSNINPPVITAEKQYSSIISQLKPGQAYGFAAISPAFDALLVSEDGAYDYDGKGSMGAINVKIYGLDKDGKVMEYGVANSGATAYPMAVYDGCLMICNNERTMMEYIDTKHYSMITKRVVEKSYNENGKATYSYMIADTQTEGTTEDESMMQEMYDMYSKATVVNFTVVK